MSNYESTILLIASRLLSYPTEIAKKEVFAFVRNMDSSEVKRKLVKDTVDAVYQTPFPELKKIYVASFDLKTELGLYLTAHEFGDSPKRGAALIKLQNMVKEAGYDRVENELVDYLPLLFEFVAVVEKGEQIERLRKRLACTTQCILEKLAENNPYYPIFLHLMQFVFDLPTKKEIAQMDQFREEADLEELPYPIMYN